MNYLFKNIQKVAFICALGARKYAENHVARLSSVCAKVHNDKKCLKVGGCLLKPIIRQFTIEVQASG